MLLSLPGSGPIILLKWLKLLHIVAVILYLRTFLCLNELATSSYCRNYVKITKQDREETVNLQINQNYARNKKICRN